MTRSRPGRSRPEASKWELELFDSWRLRRGRTTVHLHHREQRLVALLALQGDRPRGYLAGVLWPESSEQRATGNLRSAVWQTDREAPGLLAHDRSHLRFRAPLRLDIATFTDGVHRVFGWRQGLEPVDRAACLRTLPVLMRGDLLPGWYDDWVIYERARLAQLRLQALHLLADLLIDLGEVTEARMAASTAVSIEPLHEPAIRALIRAEIEDGDYRGALRDYDTYRRRVRAELGVRPSSRLDDLVRPLRGKRSRAQLAGDTPVVA